MANVLNLLRARLRSTGTTGLADALAYQVLSAAQEMFNGVYKRVLTQASEKTITLDANTQIFSIRSKITSPVAINILDLITVTDLRTLGKLKDWRELARYDQQWYKKTGSRHEVWAQMGADRFVVYPMVASNVSVSVAYAHETTTLNDAADDFDVPQEDQDMVYAIAETIFHIHLRNYKEAEDCLRKISEDMQIGYIPDRFLSWS
jgi:hypothetical protein